MEEKSEIIYSFKCKHCGKVIKSLYKKQAEANFEAHLLSCQKKREKK